MFKRKPNKPNYNKYFAMIKSLDYNDVLSVFLIYCKDNNIGWSFPMLFGSREHSNNEMEFNREFNLFMNSYIGETA